jgi:hypothetical protein
MTINAWKTSFIGVNIPAKVLTGTATSFTGTEYWAFPNQADDPYYITGNNPQFYRWRVTVNVNSQQHGSNLTRMPFYYNAHDVTVGDFIAGSQDGKVLQIIAVEEKTNSSVVIIVEDRLRYNTFRSATGNGMFSAPGDVVIFQINELGYPMLDPTPPGVSTDFFGNVMSRFQYMNPLTNYLLEKTNHGFEKGDAICIENGQFTLSSSNNIDKFVGTVVHPGPGPDQFILRPANGIIDFVPSLPGSVGDYIYPSIDGSGDLTTSSASARPIFMKVADPIPTFTIGTIADPTGTDGDEIEINGVLVTLNSGNGTYDLTFAEQEINALTSTHGVTASLLNGATEVQSDINNNGSAFGVVAGFTPFAAEINGVTVNFTTTTSGGANFGDPTVADAFDMVVDINAANIANITASIVNGNELKLTNTAGGAITIVNVTSGALGNPWAGANSITSLDLSTAANTTTFVIKLYRADGGPITLLDQNGTFVGDAGLMSGQNGRYALGLNIEQGIRASATSIVADIVARDALFPLVGDQAYVINAGNGEWGMFIWDGNAWNKFNNQRSEESDARTLEAVAALPGTNTDLGSISAGRRVLSVAVTVLNDIVNPDNFTVTIGSQTVWEYSKHGGNKVGTYSTESTYITTGHEDVVLNLPGTMTSGDLRVEVTYI